VSRLDVVADANDKRLPEIARVCIAALGAQLRALKAQILEFDRQIMAWHRSNAPSKRLDAIPGVGPALATALVAGVHFATFPQRRLPSNRNDKCRDRFHHARASRKPSGTTWWLLDQARRNGVAAG
jgi:transposase